jgi:hypothetical protein
MTGDEMTGQEGSAPRAYRKRPVEVVAYELTKINQNRVLLWIIANGGAGEVDGPGRGLLIRTLEGLMLAGWGDFVIRGVADEFYPCKPDIFHLTYEAS